MTHKVCYDLGIKCAMLEQDQIEEYSFNPKNLRISDFQFELGVDSLFSEVIYKLTNWDVKAIDPLNNICNLSTNFSYQDFVQGNVYGWNTRAEAINKSILNANKSALVQIGSDHLIHINEDQLLQSQYQILTLNINSEDVQTDNDKKLEQILLDQIDIELEQELSN